MANSARLSERQQDVLWQIGVYVDSAVGQSRPWKDHPVTFDEALEGTGSTDQQIASALGCWWTQSEFDAFMRRLEARGLVRVDRYFYKLTKSGYDAFKACEKVAEARWEAKKLRLARSGNDDEEIGPSAERRS